jgi:hypothetical protein
MTKDSRLEAYTLSLCLIAESASTSTINNQQPLQHPLFTHNNTRYVPMFLISSPSLLHLVPAPSTSAITSCPGRWVASWNRNANATHPARVGTFSSSNTIQRYIASHIRCLVKPSVVVDVATSDRRTMSLAYRPHRQLPLPHLEPCQVSRC